MKYLKGKKLKEAKEELFKKLCKENGKKVFTSKKGNLYFKSGIVSKIHICRSLTNSVNKSQLKKIGEKIFEKEVNDCVVLKNNKLYYDINNKLRSNTHLLSSFPWLLEFLTFNKKCSWIKSPNLYRYLICRRYSSFLDLKKDFNLPFIKNQKNFTDLLNYVESQNFSKKFFTYLFDKRFNYSENTEFEFCKNLFLYCLYNSKEIVWKGNSIPNEIFSGDISGTFECNKISCYFLIVNNSISVYETYSYLSIRKEIGVNSDLIFSIIKSTIKEKFLRETNFIQNILRIFQDVWEETKEENKEWVNIPF